MAKNGFNFHNKSCTFILMLVVFMLSVQGGHAQLFRCWRGCLNECFFLPSRQIGQRLPCYVNCLAKCFYPPGFGFTPPAPDIPPPSAPSPALSPSYLSSDSLVADVDSTTNNGVEINESRIQERNECVIKCSLRNCSSYNHGEDEDSMKHCLEGCIINCKD